MGIILTGMLRDGVDGLKEIRKARGMTLAESEETAESYGMPRRALEEGAARFSVPNYEIKHHLIRFAARI
jgi:two-component system chemotaxis response regulator CheB